jgi:hypothetical protein
MANSVSRSFTAFNGWERIASGSLVTSVLAIKRAAEAGSPGPLLIFDDLTGSVQEVDIRGTDAETLARLPQEFTDHEVSESETVDRPSSAPQSRGRGRPKLGVTAREVTLLPRHWEWLSAQPGGASVVLRKLVEEARRAAATHEDRRMAQERAYRFMSTMAGDMAGFEESTRALFAGDLSKFFELTAGWPGDVRDYARSLASAPQELSHGSTSSSDPDFRRLPGQEMINKRMLKQQYLETKTPLGVYTIRNVVTGRMLVAGSMDVHGTLNRHRFELRQGTHRNRRLSQDWSQHGESSFTFEVLGTVKLSDDEGFDVARELKDLVVLWRQELGCQGETDYEFSPRTS